MNENPIVTIAVAALVALSSAGGVVGFYRAWQDHKKGARDATMQGFESVINTLRSEVERLREDREEDRARLTRVEQQITVERDLKWLAIQHLRALYGWIAQHLPGVTPPRVPDALAEHFVYPFHPPTPTGDEETTTEGTP